MSIQSLAKQLPATRQDSNSQHSTTSMPPSLHIFYCTSSSAPISVISSLHKPLSSHHQLCLFPAIARALSLSLAKCNELTRSLNPSWPVLQGILPDFLFPPPNTRPSAQSPPSIARKPFRPKHSGQGKATNMYWTAGEVVNSQLAPPECDVTSMAE